MFCNTQDFPSFHKLSRIIHVTAAITNLLFLCNSKQKLVHNLKTSIYIGVGRLRILGGARFRILGGGGQGAAEFPAGT